MSHLERNKRKLINRIRRIGGQLKAVENAIENGEDCSSVLQTLAACRGGLNGLLVQIIEGHVRHHIADPDRRPGTERAEATEELLAVVRSYFK